MSEPYEKKLVYVDDNDFMRYLNLAHKDHDNTITDIEKKEMEDILKKEELLEKEYKNNHK